MLPEIELNNDKLYAVLKIGFMVAAFTVITFNVLAAHALPATTTTNNTTDWNWGIVEQNGSSGYPPEEGTGYPEHYYNDNGYPAELIDDDLEEEDEEQDEKLHEKESKQK